MKKKINYRRVAFLSISFLIIIFLLALIGAVIWAQTNNGYQTLTRLTQDKPTDYWLTKVYYGLYKKYPSPSPSSEGENNISAPSTNEPSYQKTDIFVNIALATDKDLYHSGEQIKINLNANSKKDINKATLYLYGIPNKYNEYTIYEIKEISLKNGENSFSFSLNLPYCNSCSGVKEGDYFIYTKIVKDNTLIGQQEIKISLRQ